MSIVNVDKNNNPQIIAFEDFEVEIRLKKNPETDKPKSTGGYKFTIGQLVRVFGSNKIVKIRYKNGGQAKNPTYLCVDPKSNVMLGSFYQNSLTDQLEDTKREKLLGLISNILRTEDELSDEILEKIDEYLENECE